MTKRRNCLGNGAIGSVLAKNVHPSAHLRSKFPIVNAGRRLEGAVTHGLDNFHVRGKLQLCIIFTHSDFPGGEVYVTKSSFKVTSVAIVGNVFDRGPKGCGKGRWRGRRTVPSSWCYQACAPWQCWKLWSMQLLRVADLVENIDDDNVPVPANISTAVPTDTIFQGWWYNSQCKQK